jgi:hypothetical protein
MSFINVMMQHTLYQNGTTYSDANMADFSSFTASPIPTETSTRSPGKK